VETRTRKRRVGLLTVHGIGVQETGDLAARVADGLASALGPGIEMRGSDPVVVDDGETEVFVYDVYWAELLKGEKIHGSFAWDDFTALGWFPWLNRRHRLYPPESVSGWEVALWSPVLIAMGVGLGLTRAFAGAFRTVSGAVTSRDEPDLSDLPPSGWERVRRIPEANARHGREVASRPSALDRTLDDFAGDVTNYITSASGRTLRPEGTDPLPEAVPFAYPSILRAFYGAAERAHRECDDVQVVAHSLGTVVTFHALSGYRAEAVGLDPERYRSAVESISHLYTIGSPLAKIRFLWPDLVPTEDLLRTRPLAWHNFVSRMDLVAGRLRGRYAHWGEVEDHMTLGGGVARAHNLYARNRTFLGTLTEGLVGERRVPRNSWVERIRGGVSLIGETVGAPVGAFGVLGLGAIVLVALPLTLAYVAGRAVGLFDQASGDAVQSWVVILIIGAFLVTFAVNSPRQASARHAVWRGATRPE
jgi:hypothetical protein